MSETDEQTLVRRAKTGDRDAFTALVEAHQRFVYQLALRALGQPQEAEDAAQEAFMRAWLALASFREEARFQTWLYRIVINLCYNRLPRLRRELSALGADALAEIPADTGTEIGLDLEAAERRRFLFAEIERLPESHRLLFALRFQKGLSYDEIASVTSLPVGTVKTGLFRARARLREALRVYEESDHGRID